MKRYLSLLLALVLLLPGCGKKQDETTIQPCEVIARVMWFGAPEAAEGDGLFRWYLYDGMRQQGFGEEDEYYSDEDMSSLLSDLYNLEDLDWYDAAIVCMEGVRAFELAVLSVPKEEQGKVVEAFQEHLLNRQGAFTGYEPEQAALVENGTILTCGQEVALIICEDVRNVRQAFEACYGEGRFAVDTPEFLRPEPEQRPDGRYVYVDPGKDDMTLYDTSAILSAWESGDDSALSKKDRAVLEAARAVFDQCVTPDMSDYDKEYALYAWLTGNVRYDYSHYEKRGAPRTAYEPYGALIDGKAVCLGFAETFRLFMDMAGIECVTVTGAAFQNRENHAWNMVRLNGEWYCADPTWDLNPAIATRPGGETVVVYSYFNVTSDWMAETDHQWDYDSVPEATAEDYGRP